ncbi:MAG: DinB family protein [Parafilimonas sp.]
MNNDTVTTEVLFIKMVLDAWQTQNTRVNDLLGKISDEQLKQETAPGRNTGFYLFGHLAAVNDRLFTLLGIGERLHPELDSPFLDHPDKSGQQMPNVDDVKKYWNEINAALNEKFKAMQPNEWFEKHASVAAEDFAKEPQRNRLNVMITRTVHQGYHLGQMNYLKSK